MRPLSLPIMRHPLAESLEQVENGLSPKSQETGPVMGMADGDGERIRRIGRCGPGLRQQHPHHMVDLLLGGMACSNDALLDLVWRIFGNRYPARCRHQH